MEEQVVETMTIGNRVIGIKDLDKKIEKFYTVFLSDEHFVLAYDSDENRGLEPHVSYLNDFNTYKTVLYIDANGTALPDDAQYGYYKVTERVGEAFKDGLKLKK